MKVLELMHALSDFDEDLEIGGVGHFGECLEIYGLRITDTGFVAIDIKDAGPEPD